MAWRNTGGVETFTSDGELIATLLRASFSAEGIVFVTDDALNQQLGYMRWPKGHQVEPHTHLPIERRITGTSEVLIVRRGRARLDLYGPDHAFLDSCVLEAGDIVLLASGGHGLEFLDDCEIVEVKQGPYLAGDEKVRFKPAHAVPARADDA